MTLFRIFSAPWLLGRFQLWRMQESLPASSRREIKDQVCTYYLGTMYVLCSIIVLYTQTGIIRGYTTPWILGILRSRLELCIANARKKHKTQQEQTGVRARVEPQSRNSIPTTWRFFFASPKCRRGRPLISHHTMHHFRLRLLSLALLPAFALLRSPTPVCRASEDPRLPGKGQQGDAHAS